MQAKQPNLTWEPSEPGWIVRAGYVDPLTRKRHTVALQFVQLEPTSGGSTQGQAAKQVRLTGAVVDDTEYTGVALVRFARDGFANLIGKDLDPASNYPSREAARADCPNRVAKEKADTAAYVAELKRQGKSVPGWLDHGDDNRFDRGGNVFENCEAEAHGQ